MPSPISDIWRAQYALYFAELINSLEFRPSDKMSKQFLILDKGLVSRLQVMLLYISTLRYNRLNIIKNPWHVLWRKNSFNIGNVEICSILKREKHELQQFSYRYHRYHKIATVIATALANLIRPRVVLLWVIKKHHTNATPPPNWIWLHLKQPHKLIFGIKLYQSKIN